MSHQHLLLKSQRRPCNRENHYDYAKTFFNVRGDEVGTL